MPLDGGGCQRAFLDDQPVGPLGYLCAQLLEFLPHYGDAVGFLKPGLRHVHQLGGSLGEAGHHGHHGQGVRRGVQVNLAALQPLPAHADTLGGDGNLRAHGAQVFHHGLVALGVFEV